MKPRDALLLAAAAGMVAATLLLGQRTKLGVELDGIAEARAATAAAAGDARLATEIDRIRLALENSREQPSRTAEAHIALALGDGLLTLERGEIVLRTATVEADVPRGMQLVQAVEPKQIVLGGGIRFVIADTAAAVAPRTVRLSRADFDAIRPNVKPGQVAYFF